MDKLRFKGYEETSLLWSRELMGLEMFNPLFENTSFSGTNVESLRLGKLVERFVLSCESTRCS